MNSRRQFITGAFSAGAAIVVTGCAGRSTPSPTTDPPVSVPPVSARAATVSPVTSSAVTAPAVTGPAVTGPAVTGPALTGPPVTPWSGADFAGLDRFLEAAGTDAFRVVEDGTVIHEWYRADSTFARDVASAQKSVLSLLVGRAIGDGLVTLDTSVDDVLGDGWTSHGQTELITVAQLLTMTSGLDDRFAVLSPPGAEWHYSGVFAVLFDVLTTITGRPLDELANDWLFEPAGAPTAMFYDRPSGGFAPIGLRAAASDLTSIGQTVLTAAPPVIRPDWIDESFAPSTLLNEAYGYLWWLNGQESFRLPGARRERTGPLIPNAPTDLVAALGKDDQKLYISRELGLVVARLGAKASPEVLPALSSFDDPLWRMLVELRSA